MERFAVARVARPHGCRGELAAEPLTDHLERFASLRSVRAELAAGPVELTVTGWRGHGGRLILKLAGIDTPEAVAGLRGAVLTVPSGELWPLPEDEHYWHDLIGLAAVDEAGAELGRVAAVERSPASDLLVLARPGGGEALVPFVEEFVVAVDRAGGRVTLRLLPGMLEQEPETA